MMNEAEQLTKQIQEQMAEHQRLQLALGSTTDESRATVRRFLPQLKTQLYYLLDLEHVVQELKMLDKTQKSERNALWEDAKLLAFTRYLTTLVAFGLWHLLVFAQVSIIGKRVFDKNKKRLLRLSNREQEETEQQAHHTFLSSGLEYFLDKGLSQLKTHVEAVVSKNKQVQTWKLQRRSTKNQTELNMWREFLIYPDKQKDQDEHVICLLNDLWDLLESDLFMPALQHSLGFLCGNAFQDLDDVVYGPSTQEHRVVEDNATELPEKKPAPPLAKLIPCLQAEMNKLLLPSGGPNSYAAKYSQGIGEIEAFRNFYKAIFFEQSTQDSYMGPNFI
ncbi:unnamed protein product [Peronospora destructor]|uniref:Peroxisomal biogenesis factor 3 n=1 Tax=Peronospora destructor TaxID=86335 RepID=A0AAV0VHJ7_9STRA|nr:unnamed protein product [Peronospora destructor]